VAGLCGWQAVLNDARRSLKYYGDRALAVPLTEFMEACK